MKKNKLEFVTHESLKPFIYSDSEILILGSLPSIKSREENFYYAHKSNRFYKILAGVFDEETPLIIEDKKSFLKRHHIALYDSIYSCYIKGSNDSSIKEVTPTDIATLIKGTNIKKIYTTGKLSYEIYQKYIYPKTKIEAIGLPSSSSANASMSIDELISIYQIIKD